MKPILVYDVNTLPYGLDKEEMTRIYEEHKIVFYDLHYSPKNTKPIIYGCDVNIKIVDTSTMKVNEAKELFKNIAEMYSVSNEKKVVKREDSIYDKEYCNYNGKVVSKYVYYVRHFLSLPKEQYPMSNQWLNEFEKNKEIVSFPRLTLGQIEELDLESQSKRA